MKVSQQVMHVLERAVMDGNSLRITEQLDRKLYIDVNKVLEAAGGEWFKKPKAHLFATDAATAMEAIFLTGEVTHARDDFDFFPTPSAVVERMIVLAHIGRDDWCLEPSAGEGAIATLLARQTVHPVMCFEIMPHAVINLRAKGFPVREGDFMQMMPAEPNFDVIVMNPPFSKRQDIKHVTHALGFLKPNGRLVSVMSSSVTFRNDRLASEFRALVELRGGHFEPLPENSFRASGTSVNTCLVVL